MARNVGSAYHRRMNGDTSSNIENVSDTALWVAAWRAIESERPDAVYHDPLAGKLAGERGRQIARQMPYGKFTAWIMVVRTTAIDRLVLDTLKEGIDTVINLGAGLDTRPYRLTLPKDLQWIEVDFPHLVQMKNERLADEIARCNLRRIGLDLSDRGAAKRLYAELGARAKKTLVITEGVIPYLTVEQASHLADDLREIPTFRYWIQDYRSNASWRRHNNSKMKKALAKTPFRFEHPDPLGLFASLGWRAQRTIFAIDEGERLGVSPIRFLGTISFVSCQRKSFGNFGPETATLYSKQAIESNHPERGHR